MSQISQDRWLKEAQAELGKALAAVEKTSSPTPETRLLQVLAVVVDGLLDVTHDQLDPGSLHYMPSEYANGRRWDL